MSFSREKRETIKIYILEKIDSDTKNIAKRTTETFGITENTYYRYLRQLVDDNIIYKDQKKYRLVDKFYSFDYSINPNNPVQDDYFYKRDIFPLLLNLPQNVKDMWDYCFTEMMNNVLDHSCATEVSVNVWTNELNTTMLLLDNGIGIFRKIKEYYQFDTIDEAIMELFKGKLTTDSFNHSGEGIFFTSRISDVFAAISDGRVFTHNNYEEVSRNLDDLPGLKNVVYKNGTAILIKISNHSNKIPSDIFDRYTDEDGQFLKTNIPLKNIYERYPVSRSQAKRLVKRFERFKDVELDFKGISDIGQGFAHQIFVIYKNQHPEINIIPINMNNNVEKMINHVQRS